VLINQGWDIVKVVINQTEVPTGSVVSVCHCQETGSVVSATVFLGYLSFSLISVIDFYYVINKLIILINALH
jgi:hypothetical protein